MTTQTEQRASRKDTARRVAGLNRHDKPFHVVLAQQFDRGTIEQLCQLADMIRAISSSRQGTQFLRTTLSHRRAMLYFIQPSTRTFLSFTAACQVVGMPFNEVRDRSTSSEVKGESEDDTIRVLSQYFDLIIMRHPGEGFAETFRTQTAVPPQVNGLAGFPLDVGSNGLAEQLDIGAEQVGIRDPPNIVLAKDCGLEHKSIT